MIRKKSAMIWGIGVIGVFLICLCIARKTADSFVDDTHVSDFLRDPELSVQIAEDEYDSTMPDAYCIDEKVQSFSDVKKKDAQIVKVRKNSEESIRYDWCVLTQVVVEEVYQGTCKKGQILNLFEPVFLVEKGVMMSVNGYQLMQSGQSYICILKAFENPGYGNAKIAYAPYSWRYGKFLDTDGVQAEVQKALKKEDGSVPYGNVQNQEVLVYSQAQLEMYQKIKQEVMSFVKEKKEI